MNLFRPLLMCVAALLACGAAVQDVHAQKTISFQANVQPASDQTAFNILVNDQVITTDELNTLLRPGGGAVLRVTSIHALLLTGPVAIPDENDYAVILLGGLSRDGSISGFGAGTISANGGATGQINLNPGMYVSLRADQVLSLRSLIQSNRLARVHVHGYLETE